MSNQSQCVPAPAWHQLPIDVSNPRTDLTLLHPHESGRSSLTGTRMYQGQRTCGIARRCEMHSRDDSSEHPGHNFSRHHPLHALAIDAEGDDAQFSVSIHGCLQLLVLLATAAACLRTEGTDARALSREHHVLLPLRGPGDACGSAPLGLGALPCRLAAGALVRMHTQSPHVLTVSGSWRSGTLT